VGEYTNSPVDELVGGLGMDSRTGHPVEGIHRKGVQLIQELAQERSGATSREQKTRPTLHRAARRLFNCQVSDCGGMARSGLFNPQFLAAFYAGTS